MGPIFKPAGFLRLATITNVDVDRMIAFISFRNSIIGSDDGREYPAQLPISFLSSGGGFIGGFPKPGTPVIAAQAEGSGNYYIVQFLARDPSTRITTSSSNIKIPELTEGTIAIQANIDTSILLNTDGITIGDPENALIFDTNRKLLVNSFDYVYSLTQASKEITGVIRRDRKPTTNFASFLRSQDPSYDDDLKIIGMDPVADARNLNIGSAPRNPARIEKREVIYEYEELAKVKSNDVELQFYNTDNFPDENNITDRRNGRADVLSLSLVSPNYLMETIKGTVVDVYGNIIDLNRNIIPIGKDSLSVSKIKLSVDQPTFNNSYEQIKRAERNAIAFHFEMNARKEFGGSGPPNISTKIDYARDRSRFFLDIDKEGQIKMNVPASSETGNIPLLTRYENFSTVNPNSQSNNTNDVVFNSEYRDVLIESFVNNQVVVLKDNFGNAAGAIDRFSTNNKYIGHGTVYHDISKTCSTFQSGSDYYIPIEYTTTSSLASGRIPAKSDIVSKEVIISGPNANAGGRSGSFNFDGMVEINIGANSVDRQSLWLDTQGGAVINLGRDLTNNISLAANMDGEVLLQIGGNTIPAEKNRFQNSNTGWIAGVFEVRLFNQNQEMTIMRIDNEGLTVTTPGRMVFSSNGNMMFRSAAAMHFDAEHLVLNSREVIKDPGGGPIR